MSSAVAVVFLLVFLLGLASMVFWIYSIVDVAKRPDVEFTAAGQNKIVWLLIIVLVGVIGSIIYWVMARPALIKAEGIGPQY